MIRTSLSKTCHSHRSGNRAISFTSNRRVRETIQRICASIGWGASSYSRPMFKRAQRGGGSDQCLRLFAFVHQLAVQRQRRTCHGECGECLIPCDVFFLQDGIRLVAAIIPKMIYDQSIALYRSRRRSNCSRSFSAYCFTPWPANRYRPPACLSSSTCRRTFS